MERNPLYAVRGPRLIGEMTWPEVDALLHQTKTVVLSIGSVEQHGPHLPLWSDYYQGDEQIRRTVTMLQERGITVAGGFAIPYGPSEDGLAFAGTISIRTETLQALLGDVLGSLYHHGFRYFPIIPNHEQNMAPAMSVVREFNAEHADAVAGLLSGWFQKGVVGNKRRIATGAHPLQDGHAGELETSRMLVTRPELVQMKRAGTFYPEPRLPALPYDQYPFAGGGLYRPHHDYRDVAPDGFVGDASQATAAKGEQMYEDSTSWLCDVITRDFVDTGLVRAAVAGGSAAAEPK